MKDGHSLSNKVNLTESGIRAGRWEARLRLPGATPPVVSLWHGDRKVVSVDAVAGEARGDWVLSAPIPVELISDGAQTLVVRDDTNGEMLGHISILAGVALDDDIRAEVDLLRAELDMLKRAFRRHCVESGD